MEESWFDKTPAPPPSPRVFTYEPWVTLRCFVKEDLYPRGKGRWKFDVQVNIWMGWRSWAKGRAHSLNAAKACAEAIAQMARVAQLSREGPFVE